jgi:peptidoglycan/xylan/chitin deacetylase (PgdA/CDA1 family)
MRAKVIIAFIVVLFFCAGAGATQALLAVYPQTTILESESFYQDQPIPSEKNAGAIRVPILIYHSVQPDFKGETAEQKRMNIPPDLFDAHMSYLSEHGYTVISMDAFEHDLQTGTTSPIKKPVVVTFDDGWKNQIAYAFPILQKHNFTATFFIYTNPADHESARFMSWDDMRTLVEAGMTIGSHTITHPYLSKLTDAQLAHEIIDSKRILEKRLNISVTHFASPFGYSSDKTIALIQEAGYHTARTTYRGNNHASGDILHLTGYMVSRSWSDFIDNLTVSP